MQQATPIQITASPTRCPYCHGDIDPVEEAWVACVSCLARHHTGCWEGACATCAHPAAIAPEPRQRGAAARARRRRRRSLLKSTAPLDLRRAVREGLSLYRRPGFGLVFLAAAITNLLTGATMLVLGGLVTAGLWRVLLSSSRDEETGLGDLFGCSDRFGRLTGAFFLLTLLGIAGLALGGVGYLPVVALLSYWIPLISEQDLTVKEAFKESVRRARRAGVGKHLLLALYTAAWTVPEVIAGALIPGVGDALVGGLLIPLTLGPWISAYRQVVEGEEEVPLKEPSSPAPPPTLED